MPLVSSSVNTLDKILEKQNALEQKIDNNQKHQQNRLDYIDGRNLYRGGGAGCALRRVTSMH